MIAFLVGCFRAGGGSGGGAGDFLPLGEEDDECSSFFLPFRSVGYRSAFAFFPFWTGGCVWLTASTQVRTDDDEADEARG